MSAEHLGEHGHPLRLVSSCLCTWGKQVPVMIDRHPSCPQHGDDSAHWQRIAKHLGPKARSRWCLVHQSDHTTDATSTLCRWVDRAEWDAAGFGSNAQVDQ